MHWEVKDVQDWFYFLLSSVLAPFLVNAVSHVLEKLFDEWLDSRHRHRRKKYKPNSHHKRR